MTQMRITPACAGKRAIYKLLNLKLGDHPRLRGEKVLDMIALDVRPGSPPLARGKVFYRRNISMELGITPACAGKRDGSADNRRRCKDHPRLRGEKQKRSEKT